MRYLSINIFLVFGSLVIALGSCNKQDDIYQVVDHNQIKYKIESNSGLAFYNQAVRQSGFYEVLSGAGPYTVFVPNDNSFKAAGYNVADLASTVNREWTGRLVNYLIADGNFRMGSLPFDFNTRIQSKNGHSIYLTKWIPVAGDTVYTVNGARFVKADVSSSNGYMHMLEALPVVNTFSNLTDRIAGTDNLTLFSRALVVSGLAQLLKTAGNYTVFAPNNEAMRGAGYSGIDGVNDAHPDSLAALVRRHILPAIYFRSDFRLLTSYSESVTSELDYYNPTTASIMVYNSDALRGSFKTLMLSGDEVILTYAQGRVFISEGNTDLDRLAITMRGTSAITQVNQKDFIADNGVMHVVNTVLPSN